LIPLPVELIHISGPVEAAVPAEKKVTEEIVLPKKIPEPKVSKKKKEIKEEKPPVEEKKVAPVEPVSVSGPVSRLPAQPATGVSLEAAKFAYTYYLNLIRQRIGKNWFWPSETGKRKTIIYFRIFKDGGISEIKIKQSSEEEFFDIAARRAVEFSVPFPPLPEGFPDEYLGVYFEFSLQ